MEEKLKKCYMEPRNKNTNLPTLIFIFFLFLFSSLFSFFHFINFPWPALLVQISHHSKCPCSPETN